MPHPLLETLVEQPLLSAEQLGVLYAAHPNTVRGELSGLLRGGLVARVNPRSPALATRALFYPTAQGIREIARACSNKNILSSQRLIELWLVLERVYAVRNFLLWLERPYALQTWQVEVKQQFRWRARVHKLSVHAVGVACVNGCPVPFVVEWDTGILGLERPRLLRWVEWNWAIRLANVNLRPVFVIVAADSQTLERYYAELRAASAAHNLPIPHAYLTLKTAMFRQPPTAPIWYLAETGKRTALFDGLQANNAPSYGIPFVKFEPRAARGLNQGMDLDSLSFDAAHPTTLDSLATLKRDLSPQAKGILNEIGAHPMLTADELAELLYAAPKRVHVALAQLANHNLIQAARADGETRVALTEVGIAYLAAVNGFGRRARRYAIARGWKRGTRMLVRHWRHTRSENEFMLQLVCAARASGGHLVWHSELESRLYYAGGGRRWSYLPDGGGVLQAHGRTLQFALETDRGNVSQKRWRKRLAQYHAYIDAARLPTLARAEFRLLVITTTWAHAKKLRQAAMQASVMRQARVLPMWVTTADAVQVRGVGEPIWRDVRQWQLHSLFERENMGEGNRA